MATVFTAIDLKKYAVLSMICYLGMGWCVVLAIKPVLAAIPMVGIIWLVAGGVAYTLGAVLYGLGRTHRYMHSVFHLFVLLGSVCHFISIAGYVL
jgi:hemolysin III